MPIIILIRFLDYGIKYVLLTIPLPICIAPSVSLFGVYKMSTPGVGHLLQPILKLKEFPDTMESFHKIIHAQLPKKLKIRLALLIFIAG